MIKPYECPECGAGVGYVSQRVAERQQETIRTLRAENKERKKLIQTDMSSTNELLATNVKLREAVKCLMKGGLYKSDQPVEDKHPIIKQVLED